MNCKETIRLICEYLDGTLSPEVAGEVRTHIRRCKNCRLVSEAAQTTLLNEFDVKVPTAA
jgi:anti-sigma factor RsiW